MNISTLLPSALGIAMISTSAAFAGASTFEIEENFDIDSHFTTSADLPDGWVSESGFARTLSEDVLVTAKSGEYLLARSNCRGKEVLFTPMLEAAGGAPLRIEFHTMLIGNYPRELGLKVYAGSKRDVESMTLIATKDIGTDTEWTRVAAEFVPEADGEYCFAITTFEAGLLSGYFGKALFDDFFFTGTEPGATPPPSLDLEPDPDNLALCQELPFAENFSDATHYDGGYLPAGWSTTGTTIWRTASTTNLPAYSGEYYMISPESQQSRDEKAYTPFFNLQAGTEYTLSFRSHFDGIIYGGQEFNTTINVTVGTQQDADFHSAPIYSVCRTLDDTREWIEERVTFTPAITGPYCFAFMLEGKAHSGWVAVDYVTITSPVDTPRPEPDMVVEGLYNWSTGNLQAYRGEGIRVRNLSAYADSYEWTLDGGSVTPLPGGDAMLWFETPGEHVLGLTAINDRGSRSTTKKISVEIVDNDAAGLMILTYENSTVKRLGREHIPFFNTDPDGLDYFTGFNHYYYSMAERFDLPTTGWFTISGMRVGQAHMRYAPNVVGSINQRNRPVTFRVYGSDSEGNLDPEKCLGSLTMNMVDAFSDTGVASQSAIREFHFEEPVRANGTIYISVEYDKDMQNDVQDPNIGRSFTALDMIRRHSGVTTAYACPFAVSPQSEITPDGRWYPIDQIDSDAAATGIDMMMMADYEVDLTSVGSVSSRAASIGFDGSLLTVGGAEAGDALRVVSTAGTTVASTAADAAGNAAIDCSRLAPGVYVGRCASAAVKFVVR